MGNLGKINKETVMKNGKIKTIPILISLFLLSTLAFLSCATEKTEIVRETPVAVKIIDVRKGDASEKIRYIGSVHSENEIRILARINGNILALPFKEGMSVKKGAVLSKISAPETGARISKMKEEIAKAQKESEFICDQAEADERLFEKNAVPSIRAETSKKNCENSKLSINSATSSLDELEIMSSKTVESAPFSGTVLKWFSNPGENIMPGFPILLFGDDSYIVKVFVHEKDISKGIKKGLKVILENNEDQSAESAVSFVSPISAGPGRMYETHIPLKKDLLQNFSHGHSINVSFIVSEKKNSFSVPSNSVLKDGESEYIFLFEDEKIEKRKIVLGISEKGWVTIDGDIPENSKVVVGNLEALSSGMTVYPVFLKGEKL